MVRVVFAVLFLLSAARAEGPVRQDRIEVELVCRANALQPGDNLLGLRMKLDPFWHVYWKNPGDAGVPPGIRWTLPEGFRAGPIEWPAPHRLPAPGLMNYGYDGEFVLPVTLTVPADAKGAVTLVADAEWLVCENSAGCIDGTAKLSLTLPVRSDAQPDPRYASLFAAAMQAQPKPVPDGTARALRRNGGFVLELDTPHARSAYFFPADEELLDPQAEQPVTVRGRVAVTLAPTREVDRLEGVLVTEGPAGREAFAIDLRVAGEPTRSGAALLLLGLLCCGLAVAWILFRPKPVS